MNFDFDMIVDRRGTDSNKWHKYGPGVLPLWVADMDFASPPAVVAALRARVEHGIYGYLREVPSELVEVHVECGRRRRVRRQLRPVRVARRLQERAVPRTAAVVRRQFRLGCVKRANSAAAAGSRVECIRAGESRRAQ